MDRERISLKMNLKAEGSEVYDKMVRLKMLAQVGYEKTNKLKIHL